MSWGSFFPLDPTTLCFVLLEIAWFALWVWHYHQESANLRSCSHWVAMLDRLVQQLQAQQQWRDRQRIEGRGVQIDPATFFRDACKQLSASEETIPLVLRNHLSSIFLAGCEGTQLETSDLNALTCDSLGARTRQFAWELLVLLLLGAMGTLLAQLRRAETQSAYLVREHLSLPPLVWALFFGVVGGTLLLRLVNQTLQPLQDDVRRRTISQWVPKLYPTVAQRAAQWALHTLKNAAIVTDQSDIIQQHSQEFVGSVRAAHKAAEKFSDGMETFSRGISVSDHALRDAQTNLAAQIQKFAEGVGRWAQFEDELKRFYVAVENHQRQIADEHSVFQTMLSGYYDLVRQSTNTLQGAVCEITRVSSELPKAFEASAQIMTGAMTGLAEAVEKSYSAETEKVVATLQSVLHPVLEMENRLRSLSTPFESAAHNLVEVGQNMVRVTDALSDDVKNAVDHSLAQQSLRAGAGAS